MLSGNGRIIETMRKETNKANKEGKAERTRKERGNARTGCKSRERKANESQTASRDYMCYSYCMDIDRVFDNPDIDSYRSVGRGLAGTAASFSHRQEYKAREWIQSKDRLTVSSYSNRKATVRCCQGLSND